MRNLKYIMLAVAVIAVGYAGLRFGGWLFNRPTGMKPEDVRWIDEYQGLGQRTGVSRELVISGEPSAMSVRARKPIRVRVRLTNRGRRTLILNSWLRPYPAYLESNQLPLKVSIAKDGRALTCRGNAEMLPPHTKTDFFRLGSGRSRDVTFDLATTRGSTVWDLTQPGEYDVRIWYETYLTGRSIGVKAWTGVTNAALVRITVHP